MDRISAIRNVEDALRSFEDGDADLAATERRVAVVLRTYATEFEGEDDVFRAVGEEPVDGTVVVAPSKPAARDRVLARAGIDVGAGDIDTSGIDTGSPDVNPTDGTPGDRVDDGSGDRNIYGELTESKNDSVPEFDIERI
ncbi:hypothetical protein GCM10028858_23020 [Halorubrum pallidum]